MKIKRLAVLGVASATALAWHAPAMADDSIVDRLEAMEQRIQYLEQRVASQDEVIVEKEREIAALTGQEEAAPAGQEAAAADAWYDRVTIGGAIELEAVSNSPYEGDSTTEGSLGKAELAVGIAVNEWVSGEIVVKDDDGSIALDAATVTFAPADSPFSVTAGSQGLPFGVYDTNLVSDPLTKEIGDTGETSVVLGFEADQFNGSFFVFDGDNEPDGDSRIEGHGAAVGFALEQDDFALGLNASYINDIGDSDNLQDAISGRLAEISEALGEDEDPTYSDHVGGMSASVSLSAGGVMVLGEYVSALDPFGTHMDEVPVLDGQGSPVLDDQGNPTTTTVGLHEVGFMGRAAEPSAWAIEAAYAFTLADKDATVAISYQESEEAFALELPKKSTLVGLSVGVTENVGLAFEWKRDDDYGMDEGGTGKSADTVTTVLSAEF